MSFTKRAIFEKPNPVCAQCGKEKRIETRADKLGANCGKFADDAKAAVEQHKADIKKQTESGGK